jgi:hypothetical protein
LGRGRETHKNRDLTLGRLATRTDAEGRFWFPAVPEGEHVLAFLSTGYLSQPPLPLRLAVKAGEEVRLDLTLMPTGVVRGRIRLVLPEPEPGVVYGIPDLYEVLPLPSSKQGELKPRPFQ